MADLKAFAEQLVNLTVKEVNELAQILKEVYGIEPAAAAVAVSAGPAAAAEVVEEKTAFDVVLKVRTHQLQIWTRQLLMLHLLRTILILLLLEQNSFLLLQRLML
jgi:hypothetical protein